MRKFTLAEMENGFFREVIECSFLLDEYEWDIKCLPPEEIEEKYEGKESLYKENPFEEYFAFIGGGIARSAYLFEIEGFDHALVAKVSSNNSLQSHDEYNSYFCLDEDYGKLVAPIYDEFSTVLNATVCSIVVMKYCGKTVYRINRENGLSDYENIRKTNLSEELIEESEECFTESEQKTLASLLNALDTVKSALAHWEVVDMMYKFKEITADIHDENICILDGMPYLVDFG